MNNAVLQGRVMSLAASYGISPGMVRTLIDYAEHRCQPGDFTMALLSNDLMEAIGRADLDNLASIRGLCSFVYTELPSGCHGSREKVHAWLEAKDRVG